MKLIIDIPDNEYKQNKHYYDSVYHGTPLDDVKAEIEQLRLHKAEFLTNDNKVCIDSQTVLDVLDNIGKESEVKPNE